MMRQAHKDNTTLQQWQMNVRSPVCQQMCAPRWDVFPRSWDCGTHAASFSESCHCSLDAQWWWWWWWWEYRQYSMCVPVLPHLQCARVLYKW